VSSEEKKEWFFNTDLSQLMRSDTMPYLMINVIARRAKQLVHMDQRPLAYPANGSRRPADIAAAEIYEGKLQIIPRQRRKSEQQEKPLGI
jgi:DNA-directed RNA polymerase subunit K/omega